MYHKTNDTFNGGPGRRNLTQEEADGKTSEFDKIHMKPIK